MKQEVYLDNASTTRLSDEVFEEMKPWMCERFGNAGSAHSVGKRALDAISKARAQVADLINSNPENIIFTSGATESNHMAIIGVGAQLKHNNKRKILVSSVEHNSVLSAAKKCSSNGFDVIEIPVDENGIVSVDFIKEQVLAGDVGLVSVMHVNNEIGTENPVLEIGALCNEYGVFFHTDCTQAIGCNAIDVDYIGCDFMSFSGHKIHAPQGVGVLYVRDKQCLEPLISGGEAQEYGLRGGTENVAGIVGLGKACEIIHDNFGTMCASVTFLRNYFCSELKDELRTLGIENVVSFNGALPSRGKIVNVRFDGVDGETLMAMLDSVGIQVSSGAACKSRESKPSKVLTAIGLTDEEARNSLRVSFSKMNTAQDVSYAARRMANDVFALLRMKNQIRDRKANEGNNS